MTLIFNGNVGKGTEFGKSVNKPLLLIWSVQCSGFERDAPIWKGERRIMTGIQGCFKLVSPVLFFFVPERRQTKMLRSWGAGGMVKGTFSLNHPLLQIRQLQPYVTLLLGSFHTSDLQPEPAKAEPRQQWPGRPGGHDVLWSAETAELPPAEPGVSALCRDARGGTLSSQEMLTVIKIQDGSGFICSHSGLGWAWVSCVDF